MNTQQQQAGSSRPTGDLLARIDRDLGDLEARPFARITLARRIQNWVQHRHRDLPMQIATAILGRVAGVLTVQSQLIGQVYRTDWSALAPWQADHLRALLRANHPLVELPRFFGGLVTDFGVLSRQMVTDVGVGYIVDAFQNSVELEDMKYHALGTGSNAEAVGNTALHTEITTNHYTGSVRPTGSTEEGATANIYKTIGTHTQATAGDSITEHGVLSSATPGAGVLIDKHLFTAVALAVGDSFASTYSLALSSGG